MTGQPICFHCMKSSARSGCCSSIMPTICTLPCACNCFVASCHPGTCTRQPAHQEAKTWRMSFLPRNSVIDIGCPSFSEGRTTSGNCCPGWKPGAGREDWARAVLGEAPQRIVRQRDTTKCHKLNLVKLEGATWPMDRTSDMPGHLPEKIIHSRVCPESSGRAMAGV